jgi:hypothetical protein
VIGGAALALGVAVPRAAAQSPAPLKVMVFPGLTMFPIFAA